MRRYLLVVLQLHEIVALDGQEALESYQEDTSNAEQFMEEVYPIPWNQINAQSLKETMSKMAKGLEEVIADQPERETSVPLDGDLGGLPSEDLFTCARDYQYRLREADQRLRRLMSAMSEVLATKDIKVLQAALDQDIGETSNPISGWVV